MKYTNQVEINLPLNRVIELIEDPENMKHWQPGLISYELLSDQSGEVGSQMKLSYTMGKRKIEMIETIVKKQLPDHFDATYEAPGVHNLVANRFVKMSENKTKWIAESEFKFNGLVMKLMGLVMPSAFKKQSQNYLDTFKQFAESQG